MDSISSTFELTLSVAGASGPDAIGHFFDACAPIFRGELENRAENGGYAVDLAGAQMGALVMSKVMMTGGRYHYHRDNRLIATSGLDLVLVQVITHGSDVRHVRGQDMRSRPGDVFISDLTRPVRTMAEECGNFSFVLPRASFGMREMELDDLHDAVLPAESLASRMVHNHVSTLWNERHSIGEADMMRISAATAGLIGGFVNRGPLSEPDVLSGSKYLQICQHIDLNLADPSLDPEGLAQRFNLSRASLYRLFSATDGVANYIRERRLRHAFRKLASNEQARISAIGFASGFSNTSSFIRAFKARFGITPGDVIESAALRADYSVQSAMTSESSMLRAWIEHVDRGGAPS